MQDLRLVLEHFFNWRFFVLLFCVTALGLTLPDNRIKFFRSVRVNVYLFLVIAVAASAGTFVPLEKYDVYHSWWFAALLALMAFNVITCKLRRLPFLIYGPLSKKHKGKPESIERFFHQSRQKVDLTTKRSMDETVTRVRKWLKSRGLRFEEASQPIAGEKNHSAVAFFAGRHRLQRWGDFILHVSIVAVLAGNLMGAMFGFEELLPIAEGATVQMKNRPYDVMLKDFEVEYYRGTGAPSVFASRLLVSEKGSTLAEKRIVVNEPLDINRVRFYQASWGMTSNFYSATIRIAGREMELKQREIVKIPGTPLSVRANEFLPSFDIDEHGHATSSDLEGKNPALQIDFLEGQNVQARVWILKNDPHTAFRIVGDTLMPAAPPPFRMIGVEPVLFSGVQVGYDPGAPLFWAASIVLLVGLCMHFYMHQRRLRILIIGQGDKSDVHIGGWNSRTPEDFRDEFERWTGEIRKAVS